MIIFLIAAAAGAVIRYLANFYLPRHGILVVNMTGSFIAGIIFSMATIFQVHDVVVQAIFGGFAGSLTTYSTVAVTTAEQRLNHTGSALKTWTLQIVLSLVACLVGIFLVLVLS